MSMMTVGQAIVKFLDNQYVELDGQVTKFVDGVFTIFGHGIVVGLGQALDQDPGGLKVYQGRNEQGMAHGGEWCAQGKIAGIGLVREQKCTYAENDGDSGQGKEGIGIDF